MYGVWYGAGRFVFEGLRTDSLYIWNTNIRMSQLLSLLLVLFCLVLLIVKLIKYTKHPVPIEGVDFFPDEERRMRRTPFLRQRQKQRAAQKSRTLPKPRTAPKHKQQKKIRTANKL